MKPFDPEVLVRKNVRSLTPYSSARDEFQGTASVYLDANENPFNPGYNRYPDPHQVVLKKRIAEIKKVRSEQIFLGNGSDEPIDLLIRSFCEPGKDNILVPQPTYGMYTVSAGINDVAVKTVKLTRDFDLSPDLIRKTWDGHTKLLFLCSPNNPSGNLLDFEKIKDLLADFRGLVIVDEAYIDFTEYPGFIPLLDQFPNLVVLQTLSKAWGLAGIRLGMCFADPRVIRILDKVKPPYNISTLTQSVALDNLQEENRKNGWVNEIRKQRELLRAELVKLPIVKKVYPSDANFLLVIVSDATKIYRDLVGMGIIVRDRSNIVLCENALRMTVGTANENKRLLEALKTL